LTYFDWILVAFATLSGVAKVLGIQVERKGASEFGFSFVWVRAMGFFQLASIPLIFLGFDLLVIATFGVPYLPFVYFGIKHKQAPLAIMSVVIFSLTFIHWITGL
jgi:hypothetical protein